MGIFSWLFRSRDKPQNTYHFSGWPFAFGKSIAGAKVNEFTAIHSNTGHGCLRPRPHLSEIHRRTSALHHVLPHTSRHDNYFPSFV